MRGLGRLSCSALKTTLTVAANVGEKAWWVFAIEIDIAEHGGCTIVGNVV